MIYEFTPTQDLHGWAKPWGPGMNVNLFDSSPAINSTFIATIAGAFEHYKETGEYATGYFSNSTTTSNNPQYLIAFSPVEPGTEYSVKNMDPTKNFSAVAFLDDDGVVVSISSTWSTTKYTHTALENETYIACGLKITDMPTAMIVEGSTMPASYTPYANVCMPEGFNIWDPAEQEFTQVYAGYVDANTRMLYLRPWYTEYDGEELVGPWMSSEDEYTEEGTPTTGAFVVDLGGDLISFQITPFMLQTLLDSLGIRQHFLDGASLLNSLMDQAQGRVRDMRGIRDLRVKPIGDVLPPGLKIKAPTTMNVLPGLSGKFMI